MKLPEFCIRRPVFATVLSCILILVGLFSFSKIETRFTPAYPNRLILIITTYNGASQQLMETAITSPIEEAIKNIPGIDTLQSHTQRAQSEIQIEVDPDANYNQIVDKIRNQIIHADLPSDVETPQILSGGFNHGELMDVGFWSQQRSHAWLRYYLENNVSNQILQVPGVSEIDYAGAGDYAMRIWLDPNRMTALNISTSDVKTALNHANTSLPAGWIQSKALILPITADTKLKNAAAFNQLIIKNVNGKIIRLKDIGHAILGSDNRQQSVNIVDGHSVVDLNIRYVEGAANPIVMGNSIDKILENIEQQLPPDIHMVKYFDSTVFLRASVKEVYITIGIAILFVCLVVLLFLGSLRAAAIPIVTIPICLIASIAILYFFGRTLNTITLLALVLSVGLIVDDAIVMLENIHRHIEAGITPFNAAIKGSREIAFPVISMTLTLLAVFLPIIFIHGETANIIKAFAFALCASVLISGFVSLTLSPMMCAQLLESKNHENRYQQWLDKSFTLLAIAYQAFLRLILSVRFFIIILMVIIASGGYFIAKTLPLKFAPNEDRGLMMMFVDPITGSNLPYLQQQLDQIYDKIKNISEFEHTSYFADVGYGTAEAHFFMTLKPYTQRKRSAMQIGTQVNAWVHQIPGINAQVITSFSGPLYQNAFQFAVFAQQSYPQLQSTIQALIEKLKAYPGLTNVYTDMKFNDQGYAVTINHTMASKLNVSNDSINDTLETFLGSLSSLSKFDMNGKVYDIILEADPQFQTKISNLNKLYVRNINGQLVPLKNVIEIKHTASLPTLVHYDLMRAGRVNAQLAPGYSIGQVVNDLQHLLPKLLPTDAHYQFLQAAKHYLRASNNLDLLFIAALIFIYLVLAAQFESFIDPLIILLSVPLCIVSALIALKLIGGSLNIYSEIGLITLIGLIAKHGILITEFANQLQIHEGLKVKQAIIKGAALRLRPILMTTFAMICGAIPLLLATGASANSLRELGWIIVAGMFFGTFFSLIVVPVAYSLLHPLKRQKIMVHRDA